MLSARSEASRVTGLVAHHSLLPVLVQGCGFPVVRKIVCRRVTDENLVLSGFERLS